MKTRTRTETRSRLAVNLTLLCTVWFSAALFGQPCKRINPDTSYTVESVRIDGRWVSDSFQQKVDNIVGPGNPFEPLRVSAAFRLIENELTRGEERFAVRLAGATSVLLITPAYCDASDALHPKQVRVVIHPVYLRLDLYNVGGNLLPVPRSAKPSFFMQVPPLFLATAPRLTLANDRRYGPSVVLQTTSDLLHLPGAVAANTDAQKLSLLIDLAARKSFTNNFHHLGGGLNLKHPVYTAGGVGWNLAAQYSHTAEPLGEARYTVQQASFSTGITGNGPAAVLSKYSLGGSFQLFTNKVAAKSTATQRNTETGYGLYATTDGRIGAGFTRIGLWFDGRKPESSSGLQAYQRLAAQAGYAVTLGKTNNNVNFETTFGFGQSWGTLPAYAQFFAGNRFANFLYAPFAGQSLQRLPGPVVRSLGEREGGFTATSGGTGYWSINTSLSFPIAAWARPLIPDLEIDGSTARKKIKGSANFARSLIALDLVDSEGLSEEEADAKAERIVEKDIRPAINYLADRANLYSIKPAVYFDAGNIRKEGLGNKVWTAAGLGLQLNIVLARLDVAYMKTLSPSADQSKGNFLLRFIVENFY